MAPILFNNRSADQTRDFYEGLVSGENQRGVWGKENRFNPELIAARPSVAKHFVPIISSYLKPEDICLDLGTGPGGFLSLMAPFCGSITGADIVPAFVSECQAMIERKNIPNASAVLLDGETLPFPDGLFDKVIMVDTIHHLDNHEITMGEVIRVLKPGGVLLVFEPNKLNPLLTLLCALDKNEHGLLRLGIFVAYRRLLGQAFKIEREMYNGMLVGPTGKIAVALANFVSQPRNKAFNWLSPKIFIAAKKI